MVAPADTGAPTGAAVPTARETILSVRGLVKHFPIRAGFFRHTVGEVHAVCGLSFDVAAGETLGVVGESGSGKSTTARVLLRLIPATSGSVYFRDTDVLAHTPRPLRPQRRSMHTLLPD